MDEKKSYRGWGKVKLKKKVESITKHKTKPSKVLFAEMAVGDADDDDDEEKNSTTFERHIKGTWGKTLPTVSDRCGVCDACMYVCVCVCVRYLISKLRTSLSSIEYRQLATCLDAHVVLA